MICEPTEAEMKPPYHNGGTKGRANTVPPERREFIAWDGEGINIRGVGKPQAYVLFGSNKGCIKNTRGLSSFECLDHIIETGIQNPTAYHVGFAFGYDSNMLVKTLSPVSLARLHRNGYVRIKNEVGEQYVVTYAKGKYFRVTKYLDGYSREHNSTAKVTVCIFDIFSFFTSSFIKAYEGLFGVGSVPDIIHTGKAERKSFSVEEMEDVERYWRVEIEMLRLLAVELRKRFYGAGLRITSWHGPGALASYAMAQHKVKQHMAKTSDEIRLAARYAYAGGRFELYKVGRIQGPIYGIDINSAYPYAISQLPSLVDGTWSYEETPARISKFGIYHVRLSRPDRAGFTHSPGPLFHRDMDHNISFPWLTEGWYFGPEAALAKQFGAEILEGWHYTGSKTRPFSYIQEMYETRKDWKRRGLSSQLALKLCMNSTYGKLAQRLGWDEVKRRIPPWHQLEWAGWVTSYVRVMLYRVMMQIPFEHLIAVETDGIYTTYPPDKLGITNSDALGGWEVSEYAEVIYVQSGLAWLRDTDNNWTEKRRGLDKGSFALDACREYVSSLRPRELWKPYVGETTRFIGLGQALASSSPLNERHCLWVTQPREVAPGSTGKRVHMHRLCAACQRGDNAYESAHDLVIRSLSSLREMSVPHSIPWESSVGTERWRDYSESEIDDVTLQYV